MSSSLGSVAERFRPLGPSGCTCRSGRDHDGSEFGPCAYCERIADEDAELKRLTWDALRWRFTQRPGFARNLSYEFSDTESNVVVVYLGRAKVGVGTTLQDAIDCALYLTAEHGDDVPFEVILAFWRQHFRERRTDGWPRYVRSPLPQFDLDDDGVVRLKALEASAPQTPRTGE